jgi:hypothetical protein
MGDFIMKKKTYSREHYRMTIDILSGMPFQKAADQYGLNSDVHALKIFRKTLVCTNIFLGSHKSEIVKNNYDINYVRQLWRDTQWSKL